MSDDLQFTRGDVVRLKSGGPDMTITGQGDEQPDNFFCQWFVDGIAHDGWFAGVALVKSVTQNSTRGAGRARGRAK